MPAPLPPTTDPIVPPADPVPVSPPPVSNQLKVYKVIIKSGPKPVYQYFASAAMQAVSGELFAATDASVKDVGLSSFVADVSSVNLLDFLNAGGVLMGPIELK